MMAPNAHVYFFAHMLSAEDVVTDGREGKPFSIDNDTFFVWIDLQPSAKFAHPTRYVFISAQDVRIQDGLWWPVVNGVSHFDHNRPMASPCTPFDLAFSTGGSSKRAEVYVYPYLLSSHAKLTDGPSGKPFSLEGNSLLIWIDRQPYYLKDYLRQHGVPDAFEGWVNTGTIDGISRDGRIVVGWGAGPRDFTGYVVLLPALGDKQ